MRSATGPGSDASAGPGRRLRPRHRPPLAIRVVVGLLAVGGTASVAALMLSDRAPGALGRLFGDTAERLSARIDTTERLPATDRLPESDFLVHVGLWATVALLVGLTLWTWRGLVLGSLAVLVASAIVETGQGRYSTTRAVESSDLGGNAVGVALGMLAAALCYLAWSSVAAIVASVRRG